jgi:hypothetical protein
VRVEGKLMNGQGELIASGICEVDREKSQVTMWPSWELHMLERERGVLSLALDGGPTLTISDKHLTIKLRGEAQGADNRAGRISVYRLRILDRVPEHLRTGYLEPGEEPLMELVRKDEAARTESASALESGS